MGTAVGALKTAAGRRGMTLEQYRARLDAGDKWCSGCKAWCPVATFASDCTRGDGLSTKCAECRGRERRAQDPQKRLARGRMHARIRRGTMPRASELPCADCGATWEPGLPLHEYDHHRGYTDDVEKDVRALCRQCHVTRTVERGEFRYRRIA